MSYNFINENLIYYLIRIYLKQLKSLVDKSQKNSLMMSDSESDAIYESQSVPLNIKMNGLSSNGTLRDNHNINA